MAQQTAVQFLIEQLKGYEYDGNDFIFTGIISSELIEQAKQMEKVMNEYSWVAGAEYSILVLKDKTAKGSKESFEEYYNETCKP